MLPSLEFKDIESFAEYLGQNEIHQQNNPNTNARLFIVECRHRVAKIYKGLKNETENGEKIAFTPDIEKNIENLIKITELLSTGLFPQIALPTALISFCGQIVGYEMPYISGVDLGTALSDPRYSHDQKVGWFNQLAYIILSLPDGVFVGDLHSQNVLVRDNGIIALIDVDGFSLASSNLLTCPAMYIEDLPPKYYDAHGCLKISRETDILCLFRMFFRYLFEGQDIAYFSSSWKARLPEYLEKRGMPLESIAAVSTLFSDEENFIQPGMFTCWNDISPRAEYQNSHLGCLFCNNAACLSVDCHLSQYVINSVKANGISRTSLQRCLLSIGDTMGRDLRDLSPVEIMCIAGKICRLASTEEDNPIVVRQHLYDLYASIGNIY